MASEDRYTHKSNKRPESGNLGGSGAEKKAEATAGSPPTPTDEKGANHTNDAGPTPGTSATMGEMASRHGRDRDDMGKRHMRELGEMHARHADEMKGMSGKHAKEMGGAVTAPGEGAAEDKAGASAGTPKELGVAKSEGSKGSEP